VPLLISEDAVARGLLYATLVGALVTESVATYLGQKRSENGRGGLGAFAESVLATVFGRSSGGESADRGTKRLVIWSAAIGLAAGLLIAIHLPSLRFGANTWATFALAIVLAWLGIALRVWAVWSLGRFFQREVMIQAGHVVWRGGPYRWLRHPAYAGSLLTYFAFGLAFGSWVSAFVVAAILSLAFVRRIHVEEAELSRALGEPYHEYVRDTARLVPGVW
jgi:protein-S-isoprenylcysteine O-methyltransferase Ste14